MFGCGDQRPPETLPFESHGSSAKTQFPALERGRRVPRRNFPRWSEVVAGLKKYGLTIGQAGLAETSVGLPVDSRAWDFENARLASLGLLKNCRLFLGTDSGLTHLAAAMGKPIIAFRRPDGGPDILNSFSKIMASRRQSYFQEVAQGWEFTESIVAAVAAYFKKT
jgi:hypothetical protein